MAELTHRASLLASSIRQMSDKEVLDSIFVAPHPLTKGITAIAP
jgi:hypothetical protein